MNFISSLQRNALSIGGHLKNGAERINLWNRRLIREIQVFPQYLQQHPKAATFVFIAANTAFFVTAYFANKYMDPRLASRLSSLDAKHKIFRYIPSKSFLLGASTLAFNHLIAKLLKYRLSLSIFMTMAATTRVGRTLLTQFDKYLARDEKSNLTTDQINSSPQPSKKGVELHPTPVGQVRSPVAPAESPANQQRNAGTSSDSPHNSVEGAGRDAELSETQERDRGQQKANHNQERHVILANIERRVLFPQPCRPTKAANLKDEEVKRRRVKIIQQFIGRRLSPTAGDLRLRGDLRREDLRFASSNSPFFLRFFVFSGHSWTNLTGSKRNKRKTPNPKSPLPGRALILNKSAPVTGLSIQS